MAGVAITCGLMSAAHAQDITGGIDGKVTDAGGKAIGAAPVTITYEPTNTVFQTTTGTDGYYSIRNLQVGGPYRVSGAEPNYVGQNVEVGAIAIGAPYELNLALQSSAAAAMAGAATQAITVTASRVGGTLTTQTGPRSTFNAAEIQELPSFSRDLKDTARTNPFVTIDPTSSDAIIIAGANNHTNTI